ncbi:MAG: DUF1552 domain-containing protein [Myxococcota bacterium]
MGKRWSLSRRAFLGGAGTTVALPFLESMMPSMKAARAQGDRNVRLCFVWVGNGMMRNKLTPTQEGTGFDLPENLQPIAPVREHVTVLSGISNRVGQGTYTYPDGTRSSDGPGDHARDTGTFLTCARLNKTSNESQIRNGISVDQVAANHLRTFTPEVPSLVMDAKGGSHGGDSGYSPIYKSNISWANETTPMDKLSNTDAIFNRLFQGVDPTATAEETARRQRLEQSVLDYVRDDRIRLEARLGVEDRARLENYFTGIRHLETRIQGAELTCDPGASPGDVGDFRQKIDVMYDLITLAFKCDRTRVATLMHYKNDSRYDFLQYNGSAINGNHHGISHLTAGASDMRKIEIINRWQMGSFAELVARVAAEQDFDGSSLLDNTIIMFGGGLDATGHGSGDTLGDLSPRQSGPVHRHTNLPLFLAGRGGGAVTPGRHVVYNDDEPLADLYIAMLQAAGVPADTFSLDGTQPISGLT